MHKYPSSIPISNVLELMKVLNMKSNVTSIYKYALPVLAIYAQIHTIVNSRFWICMWIQSGIYMLVNIIFRVIVILFEYAYGSLYKIVAYPHHVKL
jgi:hypothetical protein